MDFYMLPGSAPCRAVQLTAIAVGAKLNEKLLHLHLGEQLTPEFIKVRLWFEVNVKIKSDTFCDFKDQSPTCDPYFSGQRLLFVGIQSYNDLLGGQVR